MRSWNATSDAHTAGPSNYVQHETPRAPRFGTITKGSPRTTRKGTLDSVKKSAKLPGFYNSFAMSTPVRPSQAHNTRRKKGDMGEVSWKGKERTSLFGEPSQFFSTGPPPPSPPSSPTRIRASADIDMRSDDAPAYPADDGDVVYDDLEAGMSEAEMMDDNADDMLEELDEVESLDFKEDVRCNNTLYISY